MILGIGTDLANIDRIEATLARFGDRFRNRVFTEREQRKAERRADRAPHLCQTLGRERGLFQGAGHRPAHGHRLADMAVTNLPPASP
jgi:holo-[acyl-carrier protein] synthase